MIAALLAVLALVSALAALLLLRSLGPRYRVGRLLAATPTVAIEQAIELARSESPAYVRVHGRITSAEEFPDENDRPLVFRRTRIELADSARRWTTHVDEREAVPFGVESRSSFIAVDQNALDLGLVVVPRQAEGAARDVPAGLAEGLPPGGDPSAPARLTIDQLSAVEHATVCGQPLMRDGGPFLTAGLGRPLIVTSLDEPAAMRVLAGNRRGRVVAAAGLLIVSLGLAVAALVGLLMGI